MTTDPRGEKVATFALTTALLFATITGGFATHAAFTDEGTVAVDFGVAAVNGDQIAATNTGGEMTIGTAATNTGKQSMDGGDEMGGLNLPSTAVLLAPAVAGRRRRGRPDGSRDCLEADSHV